MSLTGNFAALRRMSERLGELAEIPSRTARAVADRLEEAIQDEFSEGTDPYGTPWAPLSPVTVAWGRTPPPLTATGAMRGTLVVRPLAGAGVGITIDHPAGPHQTGWDGPQGSGPARPILPSRGELPPAWVEIIEAEAEREFRGATR